MPINPWNMLKYVRSIHFINLLIRGGIRNSTDILNRISLHWRVSGNIKLRFGSIDFSLFTHSDDPIADHLFYKREYIEYYDLMVFLQLSKKMQMILDIGANTGIYSILSAKSNPQAHIFSFEPNPNNMARLKKNIALNKLTNITTVEGALGEVRKIIDFYLPEDDRISDTSSALKEFSESTYKNELGWKSIRVEQSSLDDFFKRNAITQLDLIKIDVEGYEVNVLEGAKNVLQKYRPIILCEIFLTDENRIYFEEFMKKYDYISYMILTDGLLRLDKGLEENFRGLNYLFSSKRTNNAFTPFKNIDSLIEDLC